jgi:mRNA interferase MazF
MLNMPMARRAVLVQLDDERLGTVREIPTEVVLSKEDGMSEQCALSFDNVTTLPKALLTERICRLGVERLVEACRALEVA